MAASKNESQAIIRKAHLARVRTSSRVAFCFTQDLFFLFAPRSRAPGIINQPAMGGGGDPRSRIVRNALGRPSREGRRKSILHRLLGKVKRTGNPDEAGDDPSGLLPEDRFDDAAKVIHWRTARLPPPSSGLRL